MSEVKKLQIKNYRSIKNQILNFRKDEPVILIGENNAGKSNILEAIDILLGEKWPSNYEPKDHEFFKHDTDKTIKIAASFFDTLGRFDRIKWEYDGENEDPIEYKGITPNSQKRYIKNQDKENLICIKIDADRRLNYQLSYKSKYTMLSKLMRKFHKTLEQEEDVKSDLEEKFEETKELFHQIGAFKGFRDSLQEDFTNIISTMSYSLDVDFEAYNPTNFFHALKLQARRNGEPRDFEELGTGEEQVLAISFAHAYAKSFHEDILLAIEEPEAHLHPLAQDWLARKIKDLCSEGLQIILETHSPLFVDILNLDGLALVRKENEETKITQKTREEFADYCIRHGAPESRTSPENILPFYKANVSREILEGFFAKKVVLVEGPTESLALPIYFRGLKVDTAKEGIDIIPVHGKGNLAKWVRLFTIYKIPVYVVFDNDDEDDNEGTHREDILNTLGEANIQTALTEDDFVVRERYAIFGEDFEKCLRTLFSSQSYENLEHKAETEMNIDTKPFKARYVANQLAHNWEDHPHAQEKFQELIDKIKSCPLELPEEEPDDFPF